MNLPEEFNFIYGNDEGIVFKAKTEGEENIRVTWNKPEGIRGTTYKKDVAKEYIKKGEWTIV